MPNKGKIPVIILAAGEGRRLQGLVKPLVTVGGEAMLDRAIRQARALGSPVCVVTGARALLLRLRARHRPDRWVFNPRWSEGMATSLQQGLAALPSTAAGAVVMLVDQPLVPAAHFSALLAEARRDPSRPVATTVAGGPGVPAYLPRTLWPAVMKLEGDRGARSILVRAGAKSLECGEAQLDVDTIEDRSRAQQRAAALRA